MNKKGEECRGVRTDQYWKGEGGLQGSIFISFFFSFSTLIEPSNVSFSVFLYIRYFFFKSGFISFKELSLVHLLVVLKKIPTCGSSTHFLFFFYFLTNIEISNVSFSLLLNFRDLLLKSDSNQHEKFSITKKIVLHF